MCRQCGANVELRVPGRPGSQKTFCSPICNQRNWRAAHRDQKRADNRTWAKANPKKVRISARAWEQANRGRVNTASRARYHKNPERVNARSRTWQRANPEHMRAYRITTAPATAVRGKAWRKANPDKAITIKHRRRAHQRAAFGSHTTEQWRELVVTCDNRCTYCGEKGKPLSRDHIVPLVRGGSNDIGNITPACRSCNCSKGVKFFQTFVAQLELDGRHV